MTPGGVFREEVAQEEWEEGSGFDDEEWGEVCEHRAEVEGGVRVICSDCVNALRRQYVRDVERITCMLDHERIDCHREMKCSRFKRDVASVVIPMPVFNATVTHEGPIPLLEEKEAVAVNDEVVVNVVKKKGRPLGWRKRK